MFFTRQNGTLYKFLARIVSIGHSTVQNILGLKILQPSHIDLFFPNVTPKLLNVFPAWVSPPNLDFMSKVMQITLATTGL